MNAAPSSRLIAIFIACVPALTKAEEATKTPPQAAANPAPKSVRKPNEITARTAVYARIIIPVDKPAEGKQSVDPWIAKQLADQGKTHVAAASDWVRLNEPDGDKEYTTIWNGHLGDKPWGCPAWGQVSKRTPDGMVKVKLDGFLPVVPSVKGATLAAKPGSTAIAEIEKGLAYVALRIGPPEEVPAPK